MGRDVYANNNAIACKTDDGKVIAAFPDTCMSPPSPPAGPIPVPYPDSSFAKDMKNGSRSVKIGGKEVMLKDQSYYKSSPLGNEAATRSFGASILVHTITGKTYFGAWSMDVMVEGMNVCRHVDITTSNHASYPGGTPPFPNLSQVNMALARLVDQKCPCCGKDAHATGVAMNMEEWYLAHNPPTRRQPNIATDIQNLIQRARDRPGCTCAKRSRKPLLPSPPCDVFFAKPAIPAARTAQGDAIKARWNSKRRRFQKKMGVPTGAALTAHATQRFMEKFGRGPTPTELANEERLQAQSNHLTPKSAGGCPDNPGNIQPNYSLCAACQMLDEEFSQYQ
jgi:Domain of unknown function (DUF4150)